MKEEIKNLWVSALRSGKYKQGKGRLKNYDNSFCCLGVLCDISGQCEWNSYNYYSSHENNLPKKVVEWAGMKTSEGIFSNFKPLSNNLMYLNDSGYSFEKIADVIEEKWENL